MKRIVAIPISIVLGLGVDQLIESITGAEYSPTFLISVIFIYYLSRKGSKYLE